LCSRIAAAASAANLQQNFSSRLKASNSQRSAGLAMTGSLNPLYGYLPKDAPVEGRWFSLHFCFLAQSGHSDGLDPTHAIAPMPTLVRKLTLRPRMETI
jgi:hypothetical protein